MGTANYDFTYLQPTNQIDLVGDTTTFLNEIDASMHKIDLHDKHSKSVLNGSKCVFIGDSWNAGVVDGQLQTYDEQNGWGRMLEELTGVHTLNNYAQPSGGFVATSNNRNFVTMITQAANAIQEKDNVDFIVVAGGINDANGGYTYNEVYSAVNQFINIARLNFKNAQIVVFPMLFSGHSEVRYVDVRTKNAIVDAAKFSGVSVCEETPEWLFGVKAYYGSTNQGHHTTLDGMRVVAGNMASFISGGTTHLVNVRQQRDTSKTSYVNWSTFNVEVKNGFVRFNGFGSWKDLQGEASPRLFDITDDYFKGLDNFKYVVIPRQSGIAMIKIDASGCEVSSWLGGSSPSAGQQVYVDFTVPFAF